LQFRIFKRVITIYNKKSGKDFSFNFRITKLEAPVIGINSNLDSFDVYDPRAKHCLLLDYDDELPLPELIQECKRIQEKFKDVLGDAYIFESSPKKYHVHFYQRMPYFYALKIIHFSKCDNNFKKWRMIRSNMTLRLSPKETGFIPKFVMVVPSRYWKEEISFVKKEMASLLNMERKIKGEKNRR